MWKRRAGWGGIAGIALALVGWVASAGAQSSCLPRFATGPQFPYPAIADRGTDNVVLASTLWDPDGTGYQRERLVIAGAFTHAGGYTANRVAMWDGTTWQVVGPQGFNGTVNALAVMNGTLYAGGAFTASGPTPCNRVAWYDTSTNSWLPIGNGFDGEVECLEAHEGVLCAGGAFSHSGATTTLHIARWVGGTWVQLDGGANGNVLAMKSFLGRLYAGGQFTQVNGVARSGIAFWTSSGGWSSMGSGINPSNNYVRAFGTYNSDLVIGGHFAWIGSAVTSANNLARYTPSGSAGTFTGMTDFKLQPFDITSLLQVGGDLFVGGTDGTNLLLRFDGSAWYYEAYGNSPGIGQAAFTLARYDNEVHAGGNFAWLNGGLTSNHIARRHDGNWQPVTPRLNGQVHAFGGFSSLIVGGNFEQSMPDFAKTMGMLAYNNGTFSSYGVLNSAVRSFFVSSNGVFGLPRLYAGGNLASAGTSAPGCNNIASWQGPVGAGGVEGNWSTVVGGFTYLGTPSNATVYAQTGYGTTGGLFGTPILHVGGTFTLANGTSCNHVAKLVAGAWQPLGSGIANTDAAIPSIRAFANFGGSLIAAGYFDSAGGLTTNSIAAWNGSAWSALGTGLRSGAGKGSVFTTISFGGQLIAGGVFDTAGGVGVHNIAAWNGSAWSDMSAGVIGAGEFVTAAASFNGELYIATYSAPLGISQGRVYKWNGATWMPALGYADGLVNTLYSFSGQLHVGGTFFHANGLDTRYWATIVCVCLVDLDDGSGTGTPDGGTDINDLLYFLTLYEAAAPGADLDDGSMAGAPDGGVDVNDLLFFILHYESGC